MAQREHPAWIGAATAAAVRLAAEADAEVDDLLAHVVCPSFEVLAAPIARLEQSADATEVATDLAGLLWAECEDVPPIATILGEPATQAALEAVAEARRQAADRLGQAAAAPVPGEPVTPPVPELYEAFEGLEPLEPLRPFAPGEEDDLVSDAPLPLPLPEAGPPTAPLEPAAASVAPVVAGPSSSKAPAPARALPPAGVPAASSGARGPATAVLAGAAAAAILLFGRRLRRA